MKRFYIRWGVVSLSLLVIIVLGVWRYQKEVSTISPDEILGQPSKEPVRVLGLVQGGSLGTDAGEGVHFRISGTNADLPVSYTGPRNDNLRELKTLVVVGRWNSGEKIFEASEIALVPHYGFVTWAYLAGLLPVLLFLFGMERRTRLLYNEIKDTTLYQPEANLEELGKTLYN